MSINWKKNEVHSKVTELMDTILETAMEDDVISDDEQQIIDQIKQETHQFDDKFEEMVDQNSSVEEAADQTRDIFEQLITSAATTAKEDGTITAEELMIIDKIAKSLRNEDLTKFFE